MHTLVDTPHLMTVLTPTAASHDADTLEELILAIDDRLDVTGDPFRRRLLRDARGKYERELGVLIERALGRSGS